MRVLALEPFYGGSHQAFLDGWAKHSCHDFTILGLPAYKWKWRMRHAAVTFAAQLGQADLCDETWDVLLVSDMLNLAEFIGLATPAIQQLPRIAYFHENQLTYPVRNANERDLHFAFSNFTTAIAADRVVFNSQFHCDDFVNALEGFLKRMPDHAPVDEVEHIRAKSSVVAPGVYCCEHNTASRRQAPLRICWNARWEHDKNPEDFFAALRLLRNEEVPFRLLVLGESFRNSPEVFTTGRGEFAPEIEHWGYAKSVSEYRRLLGSADVVVSTAQHEFFGIGIVEAMSAGAIPLVPNRLAYPDVLAQLGLPVSGKSEDFPLEMVYDGSPRQLAWRLWEAAAAVGSERMSNQSRLVQQAANSLHWPNHVTNLDTMLEEVVALPSNR